MKSVIVGSSLLVLLSSGRSMAQPTISNCENFTIGTVLTFQECNTTGIYAGNGGAGTTWDFSGLVAMPDTLTEWMVSPASTTHGSLYPTSNLVEQYSNGTFVYADVNMDSSVLVAYLDTVNGYTIQYPRPELFALRPITYGTNVSDSFSVIFTSSGFNYNGAGLSTIYADGYGTLLLPGATYNNTLRVKITQVQTDTSTASSTVSRATSVTYVWFDSSHTSALLKIDSTQTQASITKDVEYLIGEATTGVEQINKNTGVTLFPNPATDVLHISTPENGTISIINPLGQTLLAQEVNTQETGINIHQLPAGIYYLRYNTWAGAQAAKFIVK